MKKRNRGQRTTAWWNAHDQAICQASDLASRVQTLLDHTDRLTYIETRGRRVLALDLLHELRRALARAVSTDLP